MADPRQNVRAIHEAAKDQLGARAATEPEQLGLHLVPSRFPVGSVQHNEMLEAVQRNRASRGRPLGSQSRHTTEMRRLIIQKYGDPWASRARYLDHTPATLAAELNCSLLEAWQCLDKLAADLMRYCYSPLAPSDAEGQAVVPNFQMIVSQTAHAVDGASVEPSLAHGSSARLPPWLNPSNPAHHDEIRAWQAAQALRQHDPLHDAASEDAPEHPVGSDRQDEQPND